MSSRPIPPEGPECEWKERLPRVERVARTLCAFANGAGGTLLVGVRDDGSLAGVSDPPVVRAALAAAAALVEPPLELALQGRRAGGVRLVEARVRPLAEGPARAPDARGQMRAYVRDGSASRPASAATEKALERPVSRARLDAVARRILAALAQRSPATQAELARAARTGPRTARRKLVELVLAGLVQERADGRYWVTPMGYRRLG